MPQTNPFRLPFLALVALLWNACVFSVVLSYLSPKIAGPIAVIFGLLWIFSGAIKGFRKWIAKPDASPFKVEAACLMGGIFTVLGGITIWSQFFA